MICSLIFISGCNAIAPPPTATPTPTLPPAAKYTYDNAGRLTQVEYPNSAKIIYTYDKAGNLISQETKK